ncbi:MAG: hypothetical protein KBD21_01555 [Candidatus Pacebacteria bacterium]|nr:hypothetical protein [Candidatus Paceibacterota bacterium]
MSIEGEEQKDERVVEGIGGADSLGHEHAHPHATKRVLWGIAALLSAFLLLGVWSLWGEEIKNACTGGSNGACTIEFEDVPAEGVHFDRPSEVAPVR